MTRKDYEKFAVAIHDLPDRKAAKSFAEICVEIFQEDNGNFDSLRFLSAAENNSDWR